MTDGLAHLPATQAAALVAAGEASSAELVEALLARIDRLGPRLNAVVAERRDAARAEAAAADADVAAGRPLGPLHGVPVTVKEAIHVAGLPSTWGHRPWAGAVADRDATVVARLRAAGAVVVGVTNVAELLADFGQTANPVYGTTANPWALDRTAGGSSGGSAAAVAAGLSYLDVGSDLAGSVRLPAAYCGAYGLKPTVGVVPMTGFRPPGPPAPPAERAYLATLGPLARSAGDLRTALRVTAGPEEPAARAYRWSLPPARHDRLASYRVGVVLDHPAARVTAEVGGALSDAVDALAAAGATMVEGWPPGVDPVTDAACFGFHLDLYLALEGAGEVSAPYDEVVAHEARRLAARAAWDAHLADVDAFLCPVSFTTPFPHDTRPFGERVIATPAGDRSYVDQAFWVAPASLTGLPAVAAPVGRAASGLPVGAQVIGPRYEDDTAITFAELLADVVGGFEAPPLG